MSVESCTEFLLSTRDPGDLAQQLKAMTGLEEIVLLGRRNGYSFSAKELKAASASLADGASAPARPGPPPADTSFFHYEYRIADLPGFEPVAAELPRLKVRPPSVDLAELAADFREEDMWSTSLSPADPRFRAWYRKATAEPARLDGSGLPVNRGFHLVNLDEHVTHPGYGDYLAAKGRVVTALERVFGGEVRFSGSLWYPPSGYRLWHTNEDQPGWRMYVIDTDRPFGDPERSSFFRYMNPRTREVVTLPESPRTVRFFRIEQDPEKLFWHCIVNPTDRHRWSFGFAVPDNWMDRLRLPA
ncbi:Nif11-like leader peptide family natural product precursor [Streptomyces olivoreticuli]|uniref:Nif11-like leader peptide family natural product precursor n=1 Tax=Streptomyces olivoreticuli TaxID=68246 RepID=UPI00265A7465|nr:Nif11-like leader peptide family natural product precursor [Streptomyces olivoreticuli]WKK22658.1 Nif11-like leader peptide family natural product precursor [Streptomyces olivoreticuli]